MDQSESDQAPGTSTQFGLLNASPLQQHDQGLEDAGGPEDVGDHMITNQDSPPNVIVDDSPLQPCLDRNKESLRVKLLLRRPMTQLVEQGILPPPKTPAAFAGQRVRLERARMSDMLKAKIQQRPARQELVRQHILEDTNERVAPSLAEKQRMLKRARLADSLNDHLIHRPGPLELVQKNILHASDAEIEQAIKEGNVEFKPTSEGHVPGPQVPNTYLCGDDESSSDLSSSADTSDLSASSSTKIDACSASVTKTDPIVKQTIVCPIPKPSDPETPPPPPLPAAIHGCLQLQLKNGIGAVELIPQAILAQPAVTAFLAPEATLTNPSSLSSTSFMTVLQGSNGTCGSVQNNFMTGSIGKSKSSRKSGKSKSTTKARTIKFHEYKGPPNAQRGMNQLLQNAAPSSYELLLQQQQLFLQWQLEWQHKYPQILLPAVPKPETSSQKGTGALSSNTTLLNKPPITTFPVIAAKPATKIMPVPFSDLKVMTQEDSSVSLVAFAENGKLPGYVKIKPSRVQSGGESPTNSSVCSNKFEEWKVNDLKAELKRRNLPVSGSKTQLITRLKHATTEVLSQKSLASSAQLDTPIVECRKSLDENSSSSNDVMEVSESQSNSIETPLPVSPKSSSEHIMEQSTQNEQDTRIFDTSDESKTLDHHLIKEQQRQILILKNALQSSQYQLQQMRSSQAAEGQKHRVALQQHLQNKMQQQALQVELQKLVELQAAQQKQQNSNTKSSCGSDTRPSKDHELSSTDHTTPSAKQPSIESQVNVDQPSFTFVVGTQKNDPQCSKDGQFCIVTSHVTNEPPSNKSDVMLEGERAHTSELDPSYTTISHGFTPGRLDFESLISAEPIKSQMVEDVLEILIRNGELPSTAAQDPIAVNSYESSNHAGYGKVSLDAKSSRIPPPPPLPPPNFAVTLPTSMSFNKNDTSLNMLFAPMQSVGSSQASVHQLGIFPGNVSPGFSGVGAVTSVVNPQILEASSSSSVLPNVSTIVRTEDHHGSLDAMDVGGLDDIAPVPVNANHLPQNSTLNGGTGPETLLKIENGSFDHALLQDFGMPMEMEYMEWLETILPTVHHNLAQNTNAHDPMLSKCVYDNDCNSNSLLNNNGDGANRTSMVTHNSSNFVNNHQLSRDPLLSSTRNLENTTVSGNQGCTTNALDANSCLMETSLGSDTKGLMSPVGDTGLWDFAI